jgi:CHAT domain
MPLARAVKGTSAGSLNIQNERLRVVYCISEPEQLPGIEAARFQQAIEQTLRERSGMLDYVPVTGAGFKPRFRELEAALAGAATHVLIIVCHGQTARGKPQLHFENWIPVENLADRILAVRKTFFVMLVACDQVYLDEGPAANSGALSMIQKGIPAVVAMQSSVRADLAATFLGTTLDHFFHSGIAQAVAEGRKQMAPGTAADSLIDWSFPALFFTEDASERTAELAQSLKFQPALEAMMRSIPMPDDYFPRPDLDSVLAEWLRPTEAGLRLITGACGMGKTTAVRSACRRAIARAIQQATAEFRPILYVDFQRYPDPILSSQDLLSVLRERTKEIQSFSGATLLANIWPAARGADGAGSPRDLLRQLVEITDSNRIVLILKAEAWGQIFTFDIG